MKVLHITATAQGGAGIACSRQHYALREAGIDSKVLLLRGDGNPADGFYSMESTVADFKKTMRRYKRQRALLNVKVRLNGKTPELFSSAHSVWKPEDHPLINEADIIHLHWVAGMVDLPRFFAAVQKPIVWTIHDAWAYTGGFHYERYWDHTRFGKLSEGGLMVRKEIFRERRIDIVSPSEYLLNECRKSGVFAKGEFHHVRYCIDSAATPRSNEHHRGPKQQWLFCCDELDYYRKGADLLLDAFAQWKNDAVQLIVIGQRGRKKLPEDPRIQFAGHVSGSTVSELMSKSDLVVHPSREDNQPNVIVEALCVGTPVLATPAGGVPEMITNGRNGLVTENFSTESLVQGFDKLCAMEVNRTLITQEAALAYSPARFAEEMIRIYQRL